MRPIWSFKNPDFPKALFGHQKPIFGLSFFICKVVPPCLTICISSSQNCILDPYFFSICNLAYFISTLASNLLGITQQFLLFLLWPLFGQFTIVSLSFVTFRVSRFYISHLTHKTVKLCLQNTLNMSKTTRVYFGVLQNFSLS